jgi:hypothetical protein
MLAPQRPISIVYSCQKPSEARRFVHRPKPIEMEFKQIDFALGQQSKRYYPFGHRRLPA